MVDRGQPEIRPVDFDSGSHPDLPVQVLERSTLVERVGVRYLARPERPSFTTLLLVHSGTGDHMVDFERVALVPGRLIRVRPHQVQRWDPGTDVSMTLVLSKISGRTSTNDPLGGAPWADLDASSLESASALIEVLRSEQSRFDGDEHSVRILSRTFEALDAFFDRASIDTETAPQPAAFVAFRRAIEDGLGTSHNVRPLARNLGYSERTISRACQRVTGLSAKEFLDQRLLLEAKRLLAHTDLNVADIARQLGFSEPSNFNRFFARHTDRRPTEFRVSSRSTIG